MRGRFSRWARVLNTNDPIFITYFQLKNLFRLYQLEVELIDVQDEMVKTKYWLNTNRKRYNDNADKKQTKKRR